MTEKPDPSRETDLRVAEAMGWTQCREDPMVYGDQPTLWRGYPPKPMRQSRYELPRYTTNPALAIPMLARIGELVGGPIDLSPPDPESERRIWSVGVWRKHLHREAATANLVLCTVLLAVWEGKKRDEA